MKRIFFGISSALLLALFVPVHAQTPSPSSFFTVQTGLGGSFLHLRSGSTTEQLGTPFHLTTFGVNYHREMKSGWLLSMGLHFTQKQVIGEVLNISEYYSWRQSPSLSRFASLPLLVEKEFQRKDSGYGFVLGPKLDFHLFSDTEAASFCSGEPEVGPIQLNEDIRKWPFFNFGYIAGMYWRTESGNRLGLRYNEDLSRYRATHARMHFGGAEFFFQARL